MHITPNKVELIPSFFYMFQKHRLWLYFHFNPRFMLGFLMCCRVILVHVLYIPNNPIFVGPLKCPKNFHLLCTPCPSPSPSWGKKIHFKLRKEKKQTKGKQNIVYQGDCTVVAPKANTHSCYGTILVYNIVSYAFFRVISSNFFSRTTSA